MKNTIYQTLNKSIIFYSLFAISFSIQAKESLKQNHFNLGFENTSSSNIIDKWQLTGDHQLLIIDYENKVKGEKSLRLITEDSLENIPMSFFSQTIYAAFDRRYITFSCYINFQPIEDNSSLELHITTYENDNFEGTRTQGSGISQYVSQLYKQSEPWQKVELTIPIQQEVVYVTFGGVLTGKANLWVDEVNISFDDNSI